MKVLSIKTTANLVALILMFAMVISLVTLSTVSAQRTIMEIDTFAFVLATPHTVGVGQETYIQFRIDKVSPTTIGVEGGDHFTGFTVEITKPDGKTETRGPYTADATSGSWFLYVPDQIGEYTLKTSFPGQWINGSEMFIVGFPVPGTDIDRWYKPSTSAPFTLTVQQEPLEPYPSVPLPTDYWTRPIYGENKGWSQFADNWLMPGYDATSRGFHWAPAYAPYTSAPNSPHILWTKELRFGGIVGEPFGDKTYYTGLSYEEPMPNKLILSGRLIYTERTAATDANGAYTLGGQGFNYGRLGTRILDLYTGEEIMYLNNTIISFAQTLEFDSPNQHGVIPHLWQSIPGGYRIYDAFTGAYMFDITNVPGGTTKFGPNFEVLIYDFSGPATDRYLWMWNSTKAILTVSQPRWGSMVRSEFYNIPRGAQVNGTLGMEWNVSVPDIGGSQSISLVNVKENVIVASFADASVYPNIITEVGYPAMLEKDSSGNYPTSINHRWKAERSNIYAGLTYAGAENIDGGVYAIWDDATAQVHAYSALTGQELWVSDPIQSEGLVTFSDNVITAYGKVYVSGFDGHVRAFDANNGTLVWDFYKGNAGYEVPFGTWPDYGGFTVADEKIYVSSDEHSPDSVLWRGGRLWCIDAHTGENLWEVSGWLRQPIISDGILIAMNSLDGEIYAIGKGESATTVTAPDTSVALGDSLMIRGTVTDQSPGQLGAACVSDESMGAWMEYLHMQKPMPTNATGVEVQLDVLDSNNNYYTIGTVTTDLSGSFGFAYTPEIPGSYKVIATFAGSSSYGSSYAMTYFNVEEAPAATPEPTPTPESIADIYFLPMSIGMIVAIIVVGAVLVLMLRRR